jgi:hypothetical protein
VPVSSPEEQATAQQAASTPDFWDFPSPPPSVERPLSQDSPSSPQTPYIPRLPPAPEPAHPSPNGWRYLQDNKIAILSADALPERFANLGNVADALRQQGIRYESRPNALYIKGAANVQRLKEWLKSPESLPLPEEQQNASTKVDAPPVSPSSFEPAPQESKPALSSSLRIDNLLPEPAQEAATDDDGYTPPPLEFIRERTERRREKYRQQDAENTPPPAPERTTFASSGNPPASAPAPSRPSPAPSTQGGMPFWKKAALAVTAAALAISTTVAGFLGAQKIQQAFRPPSEPPAPPH